MPTKALEAAVRVRGRFRRSVQLARDVHERDGLMGYLLTPTVRELTHRIVGELLDQGGTRAWSITGPYGTGKSSFAMLLSRLLADDVNGHREAEALKNALGLPAPMLSVLVVGQREPIKPALLAALAATAEGVAPSIADDARLLAESGSDATDTAVADVFERAAVRAEELGFGGLVTIVDEFGKFLEHAAANPLTEDLQVMQALAESAARCRSPFLLATILHSSFAAYVDGDAEVQRAEWQKVQGRFVDVAFQEPTEQLLRFVGDAIETSFPRDLARRYGEATSWVSDAPELSEVRRRLPVSELVPECLPLEPVTALVLAPLFRSKLAQNERSLFSFLTSQEPYGFQEFLRAAHWSAEKPPLYRLPQLYDYVSASLGPVTYRGSLARRWAEVEAALDRIQGNAPLMTTQVVKAIGLLGMYGDQLGLSASKNVLAGILGDSNGVADAVAYLEGRSIALHRSYRDSYALWEGSDVDLEERFEEAQGHIGHGSLAERLRHAVEIEPIVARAHYIKTGNLRYFTVDVVDGSEDGINEVLDRSIGDADGQLTFVLTKDDETRRSLVDAALRITSGANLEMRRRVFAFPTAMSGLGKALREYESWRWVMGNTPALSGDRAAAREVRSQLGQARTRLRRVAGRVLGLRSFRFEPQLSEWVWAGKSEALESTKAFLQWVSRLFDVVYDRAPQFHNELLNRSAPSSAANAAVYKLVKAIITSPGVHRLGIQGSPPELSMYESLVKAGGFHRYDEDRDTWWIGEPELNWLPVWRCAESFLMSTRHQRRSVVELFEMWGAPPFGVRRGAMPVLLVMLLHQRRNGVALYQDGLFQPQLTEQLAEQLARNPSAFEVQEYALDAETRELLSSLGQVVDSLSCSEPNADESPLLRVARPLIMLVARLPKYAKNTQRIRPPEAMDLRNALLKARDPYELVLKQLPTLLGVDPSDHTVLARRLESSLGGMQRAYPELLDEIGFEVQEAFGLQDGSQGHAKDELRRRAESVEGLASEPKLMAFVNRAARSNSVVDSDWREMLGLVVVQSRAPRDWSDADRVTFQAELQRIASDFLRLEELALEKRKTGARSVLRIGLLDGSSGERSAIVGISDEDSEDVAALARTIDDAMVRYGRDGSENVQRRHRLAALGRLLARELQSEEGGS